RDERSISVLEKNVLSASARHHRGQLRVAQRAKQRHDAGQQPNTQQQFGGANLRRHHTRLAENSGADDAASDEHGGAENPKRRDEPGLVAARLRRYFAHGMRLPQSLQAASREERGMKGPLNLKAIWNK